MHIRGKDSENRAKYKIMNMFFQMRAQNKLVQRDFTNVTVSRHYGVTATYLRLMEIRPRSCGDKTQVL